MSREQGVVFSKTINTSGSQQPAHVLKMGDSRPKQMDTNEKASDFRAQMTAELQKQYGKKDDA